jgi:hypothetical protein
VADVKHDTDKIKPSYEAVTALLAQESNPVLLRMQLLGTVEVLFEFLVDNLRNDLEFSVDLRASVAKTVDAAEEEYRAKLALFKAAVAAATEAMSAGSAGAR